MRARLRLLGARHLPAGWPDVPRQMLVFGSAYVCYRAVASLADSDPGAAFAHARDVIGLERTLHVFVEPQVQAWASGSHLLITIASWVYVNAQFTLMAAALAYVYFREHSSYRRLRDTLLVAMALAVACYAIFPTAPPRFLPEWGFVDTVSETTGLHLSHASSWFEGLVNPYAAVPSMHIAFAVIVSSSLARLSRLRALRLLWRTYPFLIAFVVVATGNHYLLDTVLGALTALAARSAVALRGRLRARTWPIAPARSAGAGAPAGGATS
jgi:hypothetical protein